MAGASGVARAWASTISTMVRRLSGLMRREQQQRARDMAEIDVFAPNRGDQIHMPLPCAQLVRSLCGFAR